MKVIRVGAICIDFDPQGVHDDECSWWHGGVCNCRPAMRAALAVDHGPECDFRWAYDGATPCSCGAVEAATNRVLSV